MRVDLLESQARSIGIPLVKMEIPEAPTMEEYEACMSEHMTTLKNEGAQHSIFGDIFLEDLRAYRETKLQEVEIEGVFPLWKRPTKELIREFLDLGFKTVVTCVNDQLLDKSFAGRIIDEDFLNDLPEGVDPCGENGEFHTFVFDGPIFNEPIAYSIGEVVHRKYEVKESKEEADYDCEPDPKKVVPGFWYCDLLPK